MGRTRFSIARSGLGAVIACLGIFGTTELLASAYYDGYRNYATTGGFVSYSDQDDDQNAVSFTSYSGGVWTGYSLTNGESIALTSGRADARTFNMGVRGYVDSTPLNSEFSDCKADVGVDNTIMVKPGTSGLALGSTTRLRMNLRLDGTLYAEARSFPARGWAHAELNADLTIQDPLNRIDTGEGFYIPNIVAFGAAAETEAYDVNADYWDHSGYTTWNERWSLSTNVQNELSHDDFYGEEHTGAAVMYWTNHLFDTGSLMVEFDAIVGHTLNVNGWMYTYVNANNDGLAQADFNNTFAISFEPVVEGVNLEVGGVPEPSCLSLVALAGVALLRQRRVV